MKPLPRVLVLRGKRWRLLFVPRLNADGECDPPSAQRKTIRIAKRLRGQRRLEVLIHEMLHACAWDFAEETTTQIAEDIAAGLWRCGYRVQAVDGRQHGRV